MDGSVREWAILRCWHTFNDVRVCGRHYWGLRMVSILMMHSDVGGLKRRHRHISPIKEDFGKLGVLQ